MNLNQFLRIMVARYRVIMLALLGTVAVTVCLSVALPPRYTAQASLVVDVKSPDPVGGMLVPTIAIPFYMTSQVDIINSERVARKVVAALKLADNSATRQQWLEETQGEGELQMWIVGRLMKNLDVRPSRESNVINIDFKSSDPDAAAVIANAFAQAYIDTIIELKVEPAKQSAHWFEGQGRTLRDNLEKAQNRLSAYQQEHGIVALEERVDVETARLAELSAQLSVVLGQITEAQSKQKSAAEADTLPDIVQNPLIQALKTDLARAEAKQEELSSNIGANHPEYLRTESQIASLKAKLERETQHIIRGFTASSSVGKKRQFELQAAINAQKQKLLDIRRARDELGVLTRDVEAARKAYDQVAQRISQTTLESQFTQTNASILTPATKPLTPSFPKLPLNILLAVFLGSLLGIGAAFILELGDRRIRTSEDLFVTLQVPVLARMQRVKKRNTLRVQHVPLISAR
jgi:succinoglycan biosynthesis transport protein ExoP